MAELLDTPGQSSEFLAVIGRVPDLLIERGKPVIVTDGE
jgi:hypothetical protein